MFGIRWLIDEHKKHNVFITGEKGSGKDVMMGNIVARINRPYISNLDYTNDKRFIPLDLTKFNLNGNVFEDFINGTIKPYVYPYEDKINVYISDAGNYFPSQYDAILDKKYGYFATWGSLQRQLGDSCLHVNTQAYGRVWKKLREQSSDCYIRCNSCAVFFGNKGRFAKFINRIAKREVYKFGGIVLADYYYYDKAKSCEDRVKPFRLKKPSFIANGQVKIQYDIYRDQFYNTYGTVKHCYYVCINKSKHDTRGFKKILEKGGKAYG